MKRTTTLLLFLLFTMTVAVAQHKDAFAVQTTIEHGIIEGNYNTKSGIQTYFGIPFAKPPVGDLRWRVPQPLDKWEGVKTTKTFAARPMQKLVFGDMNSRSDGVSEDCLYLNVWTPAKRNTTNLPVLVYFYGGGFFAGDGSEPRYDGEAMAKKGMVVVTCNYRLGIFGLLAHSELSKESGNGSGNYGLYDQLAALQWVQKNIAAFGGDPQKVTIAGESAGSISVSYQMASPLAKGTFARAIGESGAGIYPTLSPVPLGEAETVGQDFLTKNKLKSIADLRKLPSRDIYEMADEFQQRFPISIDGKFLPKTLPEIFEGREQAQVPLLLGWNSAELPAVVFMQSPVFTTENFVARVKKEYPNDHQEVLNIFPHSTPEEVEISATALAADRFIVYSSWKWFDLHRKNSDQPVYRYLYSKLRPALVDQSLTSGLAGGTLKKESDSPKMPEPIGAPHACEIEYCMGNLDLIKEYAWTADDYKVSETMSNYFANFIKTGNPNGDGLPIWKSVTATDNNPPVMIIDVESRVEAAKNDARFKFHDKFYLKK